MSAEELLNSNTKLIFIAKILLKLFFSNLLATSIEVETTSNCPFQQQYIQDYFYSPMDIFSTSKKDQAFSDWKSSYYAIWGMPLILRIYIC